MPTATVYKRPDGTIHYKDTYRYKGGFGVPSSSGDKIYKISFDKAGGYYMCSCPGCINNGDCKHLKQYGRSGDSRRAMQELKARGVKLPPMPKFDPYAVNAQDLPLSKAQLAAPGARMFARDEDF